VHRKLTSVPLHFSALANAAPAFWADTAVGKSRPPPDSIAAALMRLGACGSVLMVNVFTAPADWPNSNTLRYVSTSAMIPNTSKMDIPGRHQMP
jgi:hypothetical protein